LRRVSARDRAFPETVATDYSRSEREKFPRVGGEERINTEGAEQDTESTEKEKRKRGGARSAPTKVGKAT
jgi:hypothetical protein